MSSKKNNDSAAPRDTEPSFHFGKIVGFHGLQGEVKVRPVPNKPEILASVQRVRSKASKHVPSFELEIDTSYFDKRMYFLSFVGYPDRTSVEILGGAELYTWEDQLEELEEEEFWVKDLVGMTVLKESGEEIGKVVDIIYSGNDILEVRRPDDPPGKTILIPFVKDLVPTVNMGEKRILVKDLEGLFESQ